MTPTDIYDLIKDMNNRKRVNSEGFFYGLDDNDIVEFEYSFEMGSGINIVGPKDTSGDFFLIEISTRGIEFTKILENGMNAEVLNLSTEEAFFQADTVTDLVMCYEDYRTLYEDFMKYYNGFLCHLTVYLRN